MLADRPVLEDMLRATGGRTVTVGSEETIGHFEIMDELVLPGQEVLVGVPTVLVPSAVPGFVDGAAVVVESEGNFTVRFGQREQDGALRRVALRNG